MDIQNMTIQLDQLWKQNKNKEIEPFLLTHLDQALNTQDYPAMLFLYNELIGYYRSVSKHQQAMHYGTLAIKLIVTMGLENTLSHATTLLNFATAKKAMHRPKEAIKDYLQVEKIYHHCHANNELLASLYNNASLAYSDIKNYKLAKEYLFKALKLIEDDIKIASTYTNIANVFLLEKAYDQAILYIDKAIDIFHRLDYHDSHYSNALLTKANLCFCLQQYEQSLDTYTLALQSILMHYGQNEAFVTTCQQISVVLNELGHHQEAKLFDTKAKQAMQHLQMQSMSGIEISKQYYLYYGKKMIEEKFPEYQNKIAVGLVGHGSECFGFDDELSKDHDYGPSFCMWLLDEDYQKIGASLQHEYEHLPDDFFGIPKRQVTMHGKHRVGVLKISDFYEQFIGNKDANLSLEQWLHIPSSYLATATNGEVFFDPLGTFTNIRNTLLKGYPKDIYYKKIAARLSYMAQSGQYNFPRCMLRNNSVGAHQALSIFIENTIELIYLFNHRYAPYYKWSFVGLQHLKTLSHLAPYLEQLTTMPLDFTYWYDASMYQINDRDPHIQIIEYICKEIVQYLHDCHLTQSNESYLDCHTHDILEKIKDKNIKNKHVMEG